MITKIPNLRYLLIGLFFASTLFTNVKIFHLFEFGNGFSIYIYHLFIIILFLYIIVLKKVRVPPISLTIFWIYVVTISIILSSRYGFSGSFFNYLLNFFVIISIISIFISEETKQWVEVFSIVGITYILLIDIKLLFNMQEVIKLVSGGYTRLMEITTFSSGGVNFDATWAAMLSVFVIRKRRGYIFWLNSSLISILFASRTGIILNILVAIFLLINARYILKRKAIISLSALISVLAFFYFVYHSNLADNVLLRFSNIGLEIGSQNRVRIWTTAIQAFFDNILGYGAGNAVPILNAGYGGGFKEQAVHNIYIQAFIDFGLVGGIYYLVLIGSVIYKEYKNKFVNPFGQVLIMYFIGGLFQFSGVEIQFAIFIGIYLCTKMKNNTVNNSTNELTQI